MGPRFRDSPRRLWTAHPHPPVFEAERESHTERWVSFPRPAAMAVRNLLFCLVRHRVFSDRASGHVCLYSTIHWEACHRTVNLFFKTLTGSTRLDRLGFNVRAPRNPILSCHESLPLAAVQIGVCWLSCLGQGVTGVGLDWPAATGGLTPRAEKIRAARRPAVGDIAGYCPFRCQFQHKCTAKTIRETSCSCVPHAAGTVPQDVVEIDSEPEPLPRDYGGYDWSIIPA